MQDLFGSVRRSFAFRSNQDHDEINTTTDISAVINNQLMEKINSCIRRSKMFSKPSSPSRPLSPPPIRYRKGELIGCGAFGQVYTGMNLDSGELLAIKQVLIAASGATREKAQIHIRELEEEVKLLKNLSHPNIVRYLGTVREEESLNILLEFVPGGSISSLLGKFGAFPEAVIRKYTKQLLLGLEYLHKNGIMHRDIKGANILVDNKGCIKLADFGASKQVVELATISGAKSMKGTPYWMAPEVILQTGHSFSADIWSVGCTVIEMATGKAPWSQQYQEVAALFHIGSTKSHPEIPDHLSAEAKDFLLMCLQKEPSMRPDASTLLQHPFLAGLDDRPDHNFLTQETESTGKESLHLQESTGDLLQADTTYTDTCQVPPLSGASDICNLGSLNYSIHPKKLSEDEDLCKGNNSDDDLCRIDDDEFSVVEGKLCPALASDDFTVGYDPIHDLSGDWKCELDKDQPGAKVADTDRVANEDNYPSHPVFEDDDELTESRIKAFLDEKAIELKKLHTPLFEEFYNSLNASSSPSVAEGLRDETSPNYLKLPPKSRSPSRVPFGSPSATSDAGSSVSPGSNSRLLSATGSASNQILDDNSSPNCPDQKGFIGDGQANSNSPSMSFSERQRKWKEELDQELERKREMMRQAGMGGKTSSPKDRGLCRQRERTRFASPGK